MYGVYSMPVVFTSHPRRSVGLAYRLHIVQAVLYMAVVVVRNLKKGFLSSRKIRCHVLRITARVKQRQLSWASHWGHMHEDYSAAI